MTAQLSCFVLPNLGVDLVAVRAHIRPRAGQILSRKAGYDRNSSASLAPD